MLGKAWCRAKSGIKEHRNTDLSLSSHTRSFIHIRKSKSSVRTWFTALTLERSGRWITMSVWTTSHGQYKADAYWLCKGGEVAERDQALTDKTHLNIKTSSLRGNESLSFEVVKDADMKKLGPRIVYSLIDMAYAPHRVKSFFLTELIEGNFNPISDHPATKTQCTFKESIEAQYNYLFVDKDNPSPGPKSKCL